MRTRLCVLIVVLAALSPAGLNLEAAALFPADYSGIYFVAIGHSPEFTMEIAQLGSSVVFSISGSGILIGGHGSVSGEKMYLAAEMGEIGEFQAELRFAADGHSFSGSWQTDGGERPALGTIIGSTRPWPTYDVDTHGVPRFVEVDCIELHKIRRVSRFRSGAGHDYSDDFESCRSMKHYYEPWEGLDRLSVELFSPVSGTVIGTTNEWDDAQVWTGEALGIRPDGYPAFDVVMFHINLDRELRPGDRVLAGEKLGTSQKQSGTVTDVAVGVHTPPGHRFVSFFEVIDDGVFQRYRMVGAGTRSEFIIARAERDSDPLSCEGEQFVDGGNLENWVTLTGLRGPRMPRPGRVLP